MKTDGKNFSAAQAQRLRHYQGERLIGGDLQHEYSNLAWLRALHVVALHDTWGIALGLGVELAENGVAIAPGFAYDAFGRELILSAARLLAFPAELWQASGGYDLVLRYDGDLAAAQRNRDPLLCPDPGDQPTFAWQAPEQTQLGRDVPLVRVLVFDGLPALDLDVRRYARPLARPHVGTGHTPANQPWKLWSYTDVLFLQTTVDTADAGFVGTPYYFTTVSFHFPQPQASTEEMRQAAPRDARVFARLVAAGAANSIAAEGDPARSLLPYLFTGIAFPPYSYYAGVQESPQPGVPGRPDPPSATGFTYRVTMDVTREQLDNSIISTLLKAVAEEGATLPIPYMSVAWLGVEPGGACALPPSYTTMRGSCADCAGS